MNDPDETLTLCNFDAFGQKVEITRRTLNEGYDAWVILDANGKPTPGTIYIPKPESP